MAVVFTDNFTVGADINIESYPSGSPDYALIRGTAGDMKVVAASDDVRETTFGQITHIARITDASVPTGDQEITGQCHNGTLNNDAGGLAVRFATDNTINGYTCRFQDASVNELEILRWDAGTPSVVASADRGLSGAAVRTHVLKAEGNGATVTITFTCDGTAALVFADSSADRKTAGTPGIHVLAQTDASNGRVDTISVDDLVAAADTDGGGPRTFAAFVPGFP